MNAKTFIAVIAVFGFLTIGTVVGAIALDTQYQRSASTQNITAEPVGIDTTDNTAVQAANYTNNFETGVTVVVDGTELSGGGEDYTWYPASGELSWNASSPHVLDGDVAEVNYVYDGRPLSIEKTQGIRTMIFGSLPYVALLLTTLALLGLFAGVYKTVGTNRNRGGHR